MSQLRKNMWIQVLIQSIPFLFMGLGALAWDRFIDPDDVLREKSYGYDFILASAYLGAFLTGTIFKRVINFEIKLATADAFKIAFAILLLAIATFFAWIVAHGKYPLLYALYTTWDSLVMPLTIIVAIITFLMVTYLGFKKFLTGNI